jgi:competence protein ComEC
VLSAFVCLLLLILAYFFEPWQYITGEEKPDVGTRTEVTTTDLQVHYIDVGQADAILVRVPTDSGMKNMLIDAGTAENYPASNVTGYLSELGITTLHYFVITHPHLDHIGAADEVINTFHVEKAIIPECEADTKAWENVLIAIDENDVDTDIISKAGDTYSMGDASFRILGPTDPANEKETNNYSIVMRLVYGETSFMFTGDAETDSEAEILASFDASEFSANVLKVGHHGSTTSTSLDFLKAVNPALAVISCGEGNSYGHPHGEIMERLQNAGVEILRTDLEGDIIICSDKTEVYRLTSN